MAMQWLLASAALAGAAALVASSTAMAQQQKVDFGKREYDSNCLVCHGAKGKGDGPYQEYLTRKASDLTVLAKANGGVFPYQKIYETIDGRRAVAAHGPREMPIWGADYLVGAAAHYVDVPYNAEAYVRTRVSALMDYVYRLQQR